MKIAVTGHRPNKLGNDYSYLSPLSKAIIYKLCEVVATYRPTHIISGMALGVDTMWAIIAISNNIPLIAAIPFKNQDKMWPLSSRTKYNEILSKASEVINVSGQDNYRVEYMQQRNIWMVNNCDILVAVWNGTPGGTANCVKYAESIEKPMLIIDPNKLL